MPLYVVILTRENPETWEKLKGQWPDDHFVVDDRQAFVVCNDLTGEIAEKLGLTPNEGGSGLVIQMDYYAGIGPQNAVEWVNKKKSQ